ncbi:MAG: FAD-dependent oxidoreductase [Synergistaceae bacterium]
MKFFLFCFVFISSFLVFPFSTSTYAENSNKYDVIVVGGSISGCSAAIQASRMGAKVAIVEESDWLGGQMTGAAVSTMDDKTLTRTGIYREFIDRVRSYYKNLNVATNICYWGSDTVACEPKVGFAILLDMLKKEKGVDIYFRTKAISAKVTKGRVTSAEFEKDDKVIKLYGKVFIDATECGDFIPLTGADYRVGNSRSTKIDKDSIIQDITYVAVVREYKNGLPDELKITEIPPNYFLYVSEFRKTIKKDGDMWPGAYPFNIPSFKAYRAIPDPTNTTFIDGGEDGTWDFISKTGINWGNDYPGRHAKTVGLSVRFLEEPEFRNKITLEAMTKTLCFIYYMQNELGMKNWSVDNTQNFGTWFSSDWKSHYDLKPFENILKHFPPFPYVRESRRIVGVKNVNMYDIMRNIPLRRTDKSIHDSIALGEYPIDIHSAHDRHFMDADMGERIEDVPNEWTSDGGIFQIPLGSLIPEKINGLLAGEKNIAVSRIVNGSTRLHPVTMLTGQASGALATIAVQKNKNCRKIEVLDVQRELWKAGVSLAIFRYKDVESTYWNWDGIQAVTVYELMGGTSEDAFEPFSPLDWGTLAKTFVKLYKKPLLNGYDSLSGDVCYTEFLKFVDHYFKDNPKAKKLSYTYFGDFVRENTMNRGKFASYILELMILAQE